MKNKLSALEELRAEKNNLRMECANLESSIGKNIYYVRHNFSSLLVSSVFNSSKNAIWSLFGGGSPVHSLLNSPALSSLSTVWNIARPFVVGWITKRIAAYFFSRGE